MPDHRDTDLSETVQAMRRNRHVAGLPPELTDGWDRLTGALNDVNAALARLIGMPGVPAPLWDDLVAEQQFHQSLVRPDRREPDRIDLDRPEFVVEAAPVPPREELLDRLNAKLQAEVPGETEQVRAWLKGKLDGAAPPEELEPLYQATAAIRVLMRDPASARVDQRAVSGSLQFYPDDEKQGLLKTIEDMVTKVVTAAPGKDRADSLHAADAWLRKAVVRLEKDGPLVVPRETDAWSLFLGRLPGLLRQAYEEAEYPVEIVFSPSGTAVNDLPSVEGDYVTLSDPQFREQLIWTLQLGVSTADGRRHKHFVYVRTPNPSAPQR